MSDNSLPDEIISEILSPALKVSDEVFSDTSDVSPFAKYAESTSAYLLVCKSWLRVATPLLYHVVILRSKAQAKALGRVLSTNSELGMFIKKLRVEGGYGTPMATIMKLSPNISDLFLSFEIWGTDNTDGLCKGLFLINPTRVILRDVLSNRRKVRVNKMVSNLEDALVKALAKWDRLSTFDLPYTGQEGSIRVTKIVQALEKSQSLNTVVIPSGGLQWIYPLLKDCPLQAICLKESLSPSHLAYYVGSNTALKALVKCKELLPVTEDPKQDSGKIGVPQFPDITPSLNPNFFPMKETSDEVKDVVWGRVFYFAMFVPELAQNPEAEDIPPRLPILLVSKMFHRLALPSFYAHTVVKKLTATSGFLAVLRNNPFLGAQVHSIRGSAGSQVYSDWDDSDDASILSLLSQMTGLVRLCGWSSTAKHFDIRCNYLSREKTIPWEAFEAVATSSGATLREFSKHIATQRDASPAVFDTLTQLRSLAWKCDSIFKCKPEDAAYAGLSNLEELQIWSSDPSFFTALSMMKLESLRRVVFSNKSDNAETFLETHGNKLTEIRIPYYTAEVLKVNIFQVCSSLTSISLVSCDKPPESFNFPHTSTSLVTIYIELQGWLRKKDQLINWERFFAAFEPKCYPSLHEIQISSCEWPTNEREIGKSLWVRWAENLLKHNIYLADRSGKKWRARLKV
ncbi:hypothetical protein B0H17DRAFT_1046454 [Mycena rosella]|uniref:Uncharacterized protein n=1 Tax=Mycena rosella TaxID=1033263 RepID=A0AAD7DY69_MYCRO|nr:hypothetical protein B0H17DRAFT_1046454 [Mycena rosella]